MSLHPDLQNLKDEHEAAQTAGPPVQVVSPSSNGMAVAALTLGIISAVFAFIPIIGMIVLVCV